MPTRRTNDLDIEPKKKRPGKPPKKAPPEAASKAKKASFPATKKSVAATAKAVKPSAKAKKRRKFPADVRAMSLWKRARQKSAARAPGEGTLLVGDSLRGTGFVQERDPSDVNYPLATVAGTVVGDPRTKTQVWNLPAHLLNQGSTNSCVGHACAHFIMAAPRMGQNPDPIAIWRLAQELDEFPGNEGLNKGTSIRAGFKAMRQMGLIQSDYRWASSAGEALLFILNRGPLVIGSPWYPGMASPSNGVLRRTGDPGNSGHAYLLFGFSADQDSFLVANSWGKTWGIDGMGFMPFNMLEKLLVTDGGVVCSAIEIQS